jgi:voltage-gated potassium channel
MYLIESGEATVALPAGKTTVLKEGDFFGEMALLEGRRHKHDVIARARCRVLVLDSDSLMRLNRRHPEILDDIKRIAKARKDADAAPAGRRRKSRSAGTGNKQDEPTAL